MPSNYPKIGIVYLSYHSEPYLDDVVSALKKMAYPKDRVEFIIVDNLHPEFGSSARTITENILPMSEKELPRVTLLAQEKNLGFAAGMNVGMRRALSLGCEYVFLHNQDGFLAPEALEKLVQAFESDSAIGAAQALVRLFPEINNINSAGNRWHRLGFGFSPAYLKKFKPEEWRGARVVGYASGAAILLRADVLQRFGLLEEKFESYHEDLEYSLRLRLHGLRPVVVGEAYFFHAHNFAKSKRKWFLLERNRLAFLAMYYSAGLLVWLTPALIISEIFILIFALVRGWLPQKLQSYAVLRPREWRAWRRLRTSADRQQARTIITAEAGRSTALFLSLLRAIVNR